MFSYADEVEDRRSTGLDDSLQSGVQLLHRAYDEKWYVISVARFLIVFTIPIAFAFNVVISAALRIAVAHSKALAFIAAVILKIQSNIPSVFFSDFSVFFSGTTGAGLASFFFSGTGAGFSSFLGAGATGLASFLGATGATGLASFLGSGLGAGLVSFLGAGATGLVSFFGIGAGLAASFLGATGATGATGLVSFFGGCGAAGLVSFLGSGAGLASFLGAAGAGAAGLASFLGGAAAAALGWVFFSGLGTAFARTASVNTAIQTNFMIDV